MTYDYEAWKRRQWPKPKHPTDEEWLLYGAALAKAEVAVALGEAISDPNKGELRLAPSDLIMGMGITPRMYIRLLEGEANPKIGDLGRWLAAMGWQLKMTIEPLEKEGSK